MDLRLIADEAIEAIALDGQIFSTGLDSIEPLEAVAEDKKAGSSSSFGAQGFKQSAAFSSGKGDVNLSAGNANAAAKVEKAFDLDTHDKRAHKNGYTPGSRCKYRDEMVKKAEEVGIPKENIPGLKDYNPGENAKSANEGSEESDGAGSAEPKPTTVSPNYDGFVSAKSALKQAELNKEKDPKGYEKAVNAFNVSRDKYLADSLGQKEIDAISKLCEKADTEDGKEKVIGLLKSWEQKIKDAVATGKKGVFSVAQAVGMQKLKDKIGDAAKGIGARIAQLAEGKPQAAEAEEKKDSDTTAEATAPETENVEENTEATQETSAPAQAPQDGETTATAEAESTETPEAKSGESTEGTDTEGTSEGSPTSETSQPTSEETKEEAKSEESQAGSESDSAEEKRDPDVESRISAQRAKHEDVWANVQDKFNAAENNTKFSVKDESNPDNVAERDVMKKIDGKFYPIDENGIVDLGHPMDDEQAVAFAFEQEEALASKNKTEREAQLNDPAYQINEAVEKMEKELSDYANSAGVDAEKYKQMKGQKLNELIHKVNGKDGPDPVKRGEKKGSTESAEEHMLHCKSNPKSNCPFLRKNMSAEDLEKAVAKDKRTASMKKAHEQRYGEGSYEEDLKSLTDAVAGQTIKSGDGQKIATKGEDGKWHKINENGEVEPEGISEEDVLSYAYDKDKEVAKAELSKRVDDGSAKKAFGEAWGANVKMLKDAEPGQTYKIGDKMFAKKGEDGMWRECDEKGEEIAEGVAMTNKELLAEYDRLSEESEAAEAPSGEGESPAEEGESTEEAQGENSEQEEQAEVEQEEVSASESEKIGQEIEDLDAKLQELVENGGSREERNAVRNQLKELRAKQEEAKANEEREAREGNVLKGMKDAKARMDSANNDLETATDALADIEKRQEAGEEVDAEEIQRAMEAYDDAQEAYDQAKGEYEQAKKAWDDYEDEPESSAEQPEEEGSQEPQNQEGGERASGEMTQEQAEKAKNAILSKLGFTQEEVDLMTGLDKLDPAFVANNPELFEDLAPKFNRWKEVLGANPGLKESLDALVSATGSDATEDSLTDSYEKRMKETDDEDEKVLFKNAIEAIKDGEDPAKVSSALVKSLDSHRVSKGKVIESAAKAAEIKAGTERKNKDVESKIRDREEKLQLAKTKREDAEKHKAVSEKLAQDRFEMARNKSGVLEQNYSKSHPESMEMLQSALNAMKDKDGNVKKAYSAKAARLKAIIDELSDDNFRSSDKINKVLKEADEIINGKGGKKKGFNYADYEPEEVTKKNNPPLTQEQRAAQDEDISASLKDYPKKTLAPEKINALKTSLVAELKKVAGDGMDVSNVVEGPTMVSFALSNGQNPVSSDELKREISKLRSALRVSDNDTLDVVTGEDGTVKIRVSKRPEDRYTVGFKELFDSDEWKNAKQKMSLPVIIGTDAEGKPVIKDIKDLKHLLIAGATGNGKSVGLNTIMTSLLAAKDAGELNVGMIDLKRVELGQYADDPHLRNGIAKTAEDGLRKIVDFKNRMDEVYKKLDSKNCKTIEEWNEKYPDDKIVPDLLVIDEVAELIDTDKTVIEPLMSIAQMGRAAGFHLIMATQRPDVNVVPGRLKANIPSTLAFKTKNGFDSKTVLGDESAKNLLGAGDYIFEDAKGRRTRGQGAFMDEEEHKGALKAISSAYKGGSGSRGPSPSSPKSGHTGGSGNSPDAPTSGSEPKSSPEISAAENAEPSGTGERKSKETASKDVTNSPVPEEKSGSEKSWLDETFADEEEPSLEDQIAEMREQAGKDLEALRKKHGGKQTEAYLKEKKALQEKYRKMDAEIRAEPSPSKRTRAKSDENEKLRNSVVTENERHEPIFGAKEGVFPKGTKTVDMTQKEIKARKALIPEGWTLDGEGIGKTPMMLENGVSYARNPENGSYGEIRNGQFKVLVDTTNPKRDPKGQYSEAAKAAKKRWLEFDGDEAQEKELEREYNNIAFGIDEALPEQYLTSRYDSKRICVTDIK